MAEISGARARGTGLAIRAVDPGPRPIAGDRDGSVRADRDLPEERLDGLAAPHHHARVHEAVTAVVARADQRDLLGERPVAAEREAVAELDAEGRRGADLDRALLDDPEYVPAVKPKDSPLAGVARA